VFFQNVQKTVLRSIRLLRTSLKRLHLCHCFRFPGYRKRFRIAHGHIDTSVHRLRQSRFLRRPEGSLWVLRAIRLLKTSLKRLRRSRFIRIPGCGKFHLMAFRQLKTLLHRLHQRSFLRRLEGGLPIVYLKHRIRNFDQIAFLNVQNAEIDFEWPIDTLKIDSTTS
jgi:hypothetical protein